MENRLMISLVSTERVLVPIDFSEEAFKAQEKTLQALAEPSHLHLLHVLPHLNPGDPGIIWQTVDDVSRKQHVTQAFRDRFSSPLYEAVQFVTRIGEPATEIVEYAQENQITLIVIPSHGRKGLQRFLIGSVTERVVRLAPCPVLVLRR
jgi:nucleotide-binding universal stress UspA family protein